MKRKGKTALKFFLVFFFLVILQFKFSPQAFGESVNFYGKISSSCPVTLNISYCSEEDLDCTTQAKNLTASSSNKTNAAAYKSKVSNQLQNDQEERARSFIDPNREGTNSPHNLDSELLFALVNNFRQTLNLNALEKEESLCKIAESRAPEIYDEIFKGRMHAGFFALDLSYIASENIIYQNSEEAALNWWLSSPVHKSSIVGNYTHSCVACSGRTCTQIFTSFAPKQVFANSELVKSEDSIQ